MIFADILTSWKACSFLRIKNVKKIWNMSPKSSFSSLICLQIMKMDAENYRLVYKQL